MGTDYPYWKTRLTWYLKSTDLDVWDVIEDGPTFPTKLVDEVLVPKPKQEWNELDRRNFQLNAKTVFTLQCAMDRNEYNRICQCKSAKEIWSFGKNLQGIREGDEDIEVSPIKVAYQGSLMTYEINLTKKLQEGEDKKKKSITLKATTKEEEDVEEEKPSDEDDDLALITRKLKKIHERRDPSKKESSSHGDKEKWEEKKNLTCFKCKKPGHIKYNCFLYKSEAKRRMKKAMMATWSESEESSEEENEKEVANMYFMAIDDLDEGSKKDKWFLDSGCSRHMTEDESKFAFLTKRKKGYVTFGDNSKGRIIGQGNIGFETSMGKLQIEDRRQQEEVVEDPKKEESTLALPPPQQVQGESSQDLPKDWKFVINHPQDQIIDSLVDENWMIVMQEELNQFERSEVWELVPRPQNQSVIGTRWVFRNKMDENGIIIRNKARLVAQGFNQEEGIDYEETFAPIARLEAIRMLLAFACFKDFVLYQMDVKSAFLNGFINEEVYVEQPPGFQSFNFPNHVFDLKGTLCEFEMSMMGEFNFFLGLQIKQLKEGTFINQAKYIKDLLKRFNMEEAKTMKTPMSSSIKLDMDEKGKPVNSTIFFSVLLRIRVCDCSFSFHFIFSFWTPSSPFRSLMAPRRETGTSGLGQAPAESSQPEQTEARRKARYDRTLFSLNEDYQRYKQKFVQRKVVLGRSVNFSQLQHFGFEGLFGRMGWLPVVTISEPIFPTLVRAFYSRATYELGGPVLSTVRGVEIKLSPESIYHILDISSVGLRVYEAKAWPTMLGFEPKEVVQRLCGLVDP
ncbi:hypothetical protein AAG906_010783 [Vitis piasezkii]